MPQTCKYEYKKKSPPPRTGPVRWKDLTEDEVNKRKREVCKNCFYLRISSGPKDYIVRGTCDYMLIEGHMRPCSPLECVEKGVFRCKRAKTV